MKASTNKSKSYKISSIDQPNMYRVI
jgi:hypothetical protein